MTKDGINQREVWDSGAHLNEAEVWIISASEALVKRIALILNRFTQRILIFPPEMPEEVLSLAELPVQPRLIILDIDANVNVGVRLIQWFKHARIYAPVVIMTENFSRDFGARILSERVHYYFPHDFCVSELEQLTESLLSQKKGYQPQGTRRNMPDGQQC